jgi:hypothetical protein
MPKVNWGIGRDVIDDYDRDSSYKPYTGKLPPNAVYRFKLKTVKFAAGTREKNPRLSIGLELIPRDAEERQYRGYFIMKYMAISANNAWTYVPFLDAIGVSSAEFIKGTICDEEGNVRKIGNWRMDGKTEILGQLADGADEKGNSRKEIKWVGAADDDIAEDEVGEEEDYEDDEGF